MTSIMADPELKPIRPSFPFLSCCGAHEHVPDIKRYVRMEYEDIQDAPIQTNPKDCIEECSLLV